MSHSRYSGLLVTLFGFLLLFVAIPYETETVDYGWMRPQTMPTALAWILVVFGAVIASKSQHTDSPNTTQTIAAFKYLAIVVTAVFFINHFGFIIVSPILALVLVLIIGERRFHWLALGVFGVPFVIWLVVVVILGRLLP